MEKKSDDVTKAILENYKIVKHIHKEPDENCSLANNEPASAN